MTFKRVAAPAIFPLTHPDDVVQLSRRQQVFARAIWFSVAAFALALLLLSIPQYILLVGVVTEQERLASVLLGSPLLFSPSPTFEFWVDVVYNLLSFSTSVLCLVLAMLIFRKKSNERMAFVVSLTLLIFGVVMTGPAEMLEGQRLAGGSIALFGQMLLWAFLLFLLYIFPDGRFVPDWTRWLSILLIPWALALALYQPSNLNATNILPFMLLYTVPSLTAPLAQIYRYRRVSNAVQRQQTKWVIFGFSSWIVVGTALTAALIFLAQEFAGSNATITTLSELFVFGGRLVWPLSLLLVPLSLTIAILRYRLFEIDVILNRALLYGLLTAFVIAAYVLIVILLGALFQTSGNGFISLLATAAVALLFQPLRERLHRAVNRLTYGQRDEPYAVITQLGQRLEATLEPSSLLPTIVETIATTLKLPYVAVALKDESGSMTMAAAQGKDTDGVERFPLIYQHEAIGELLVTPRSGDETLSRADRNLLDAIAPQAAMAAHAVRLTSALQHSRERLVVAREEERRRIRRDLHDGLGPALASITLKLDAARNHLPMNADRSSLLLQELKAQTQTAIVDIRRLVYDLRPPTLDELGLVGALQEYANRTRSDRLDISLAIPGPLPPLSAAVEVAAYRIVTEALTNAVRHAHAQHCCITFAVDRDLEIEIEDDGVGLPADYRTGIGLTSMRERAAELGGTCAIETGASGGTRVKARLPILISR